MDCDVLIVGGGPVGLFLAAELGRRGIQVQLFDTKAGTSTHPAANANSARTMEHFRRIGISAAVRAMGLPTDYPADIAYFTSIAGHELARLRQPSSSDAVQWAKEHSFTWSTPEPPHRCSQLYIEPILLDAVRACDSCQVHFSASVVAFAQDAEGVTATVAVEEASDRSAQVRRVRARYLIGCDGPRSFVRKALNLRYEGVAGEKRDFMGGQMEAVYFYAPDLYRVSAHAPAWQYWTFSRAQRALVIAVDGKGHFVMNVQMRDGERPEPDVVRQRIADAIGADIPFEIKSASTWTAGYALVAEKFRVERVFLAGDAAHLFTPTGGLGYNTGIEDAANLAWKLEAMVKGIAADSLGASYEAERRPAAFRNTAFARGFADSIGHLQTPAAVHADGRVGETAREAFGEYLAFHARYEFTIPGVHLGTRYENSPLLEAEEGMPPPDNANLYLPCARPGHRAPHVWLSDGTSLYDKFGFGFTLLSTSGACASDLIVEAARQRLPGLTIINVADDEVACLYQAKFTLIRPDHHIAWRGNELTQGFEIAVLRTLGEVLPSQP